MDIYSNHDSDQTGHDCPVLNRKDAVGEVLKTPGQWHFKFNASSFIICQNGAKKNALVRGEVFNKSDVTPSRFVTKKNVVVIVSDIYLSTCH